MNIKVDYKEKKAEVLCTDPEFEQVINLLKNLLGDTLYEWTIEINIGQQIQYIPCTPYVSPWDTTPWTGSPIYPHWNPTICGTITSDPAMRGIRTTTDGIQTKPDPPLTKE